MRKIFKEDLCVYQEGKYQGNIDWKGSIGREVRFIYDNFEGKVKIINYKKRKLLLEYNGEQKSISENTFRTGGLGNFLGTRYRGYKYCKGDIINNFKILDLSPIIEDGCRYKAYKYECMDCHHIGIKREGDLRKRCPVCQVACPAVDPNINGLKIAYPEIYNIIIDENKDRLSYGSDAKVHWKCPNCNKINYTALPHLTEKKRLPCKYCSDGTYFPERMLNNVMSQISTTYEPQKTFKWSNRKRYDIYDKGLFIEINGQQHYSKGFDSCGGRSLEEEKQNDRIKESLARKNDKNFIDYIHIKADESDFNYIKNNILSSPMNKYYDLKIINWEEVWKYSIKSDVVEAARLHKDGIKITDIAIILKKSSSTIRNYLRKASDIDICDYNPINRMLNPIKVECINTNEIFNSAKEAALWCGIKNAQQIQDCGYGKNKTAGRHPKTNEKLKWRIVEDIIN